MQTPPTQDDFLKYLQSTYPEYTETSPRCNKYCEDPKVLREGLEEVFEVAERIATELQDKKKQLNERILREHFARLLLQEGDRLLSEARQPHAGRQRVEEQADQGDLVKEIKQCKIEVSGWKLLLQHMLERYGEVTAENADLQMLLATASSEINILTDHNATLQQHAIKMDFACEELLADNYAMCTYIYEKETEVERLEASLQEGKSENFVLQTLLERRELEVAQLERTCADMKEKLRISCSEYVSLKDSIAGDTNGECNDQEINNKDT